MNAIERLWQGIVTLFDAARSIKEVDSWDGSAANYDSTDAYCAACLIDVNAAAGRTEKAQSHCMLPVREPGDSASIYVKQAIHACAGGRGISAVKRPDDVSQDDWDKAIKGAANKIIGAYGQMDEQAPDKIYELAGKTPPERAIAMQDVYAQVNAALWALAGENQYPWLNDIYDDAGQRFAVVSMGGKLYRAPLMIDGTNVQVGTLQEVEAQFAPVRSAHISVIRQADGKHRWFMIAETAVLNRCGEIDSRALFDSFIENAKAEGYPKLRFYHDPRMDFGQADWLAREESTYLASGVLDEAHPLAIAFVDACEKQRGTWGASVGFTSGEPQLYEVSEGVTIPVYVAGVNREISVLPEDRAASWFTAVMEVSRMREDVKSALITMFGDEKRAQEFIDKVDATNREITEQGLITREDATATTEPPAATTSTATPAPVFELDDAALTALAEKLKGLIPPVDLVPITAQLTTLGQQLATVQARTAKLEQADSAKQQQWLADRPARETVSVTYRPRQEPTKPGEKPSMESIAAATLAKIPRPRA